MHDFVGVENILSDKRLRELSKRRNGPAAMCFVSHFAAITINSYLMVVSCGSWWFVPLFMLQGMLLNFLYAPEHECDHFTAFRSRWLNVWGARVCGFCIVLPNDYHRFSHYAHHRHTQDWKKDPELLARKPICNVRNYLWLLSGLSTTVGRLRILFVHATGNVDEWYANDAQRRTLVTSARWHLFLYFLVLISATIIWGLWPFVLWIAPLVLMRWTYYMQGLGEHAGLTHRDNTLLNTRTFTTNIFMRLLNWNMTYHAAHHTFPSIPFYRLPALQREIESKLPYQLPSSPYLSFHYGMLKRLWSGWTETQICAKHDRELVERGIFPPQ